ncbi:MAG: hypothetical protein JO360_05260 [Acidobacteria bacterium]|nr:hypothetical protein [Acidobacteriota bacterium]
MSSDRCKVCGEPYRNLLRICERCRSVEPAPLASEAAAEELRKIYLWEHVRHPRLLAAAWFAVAGAMPGVLLLLVVTLNNSLGASVWLAYLGLWLSTAAMAAFYGGTCGAKILDPLYIGTGGQAFWQGCAVAFLSFVTFGFLLSIFSSLQAFSFNFFTAFLLFMFFGGILVGWAVMLVGGLAGWLLFKRYRCG